MLSVSLFSLYENKGHGRIERRSPSSVFTSQSEVALGIVKNAKKGFAEKRFRFYVQASSKWIPMNKTIKYIFAFISFAALSLSSCQTMSGFGRDLQSVGSALDRKAEEVRTRQYKAQSNTQPIQPSYYPPAQ